MERRELIAEEVHSYYFDWTKIDVERVRSALCGTPTVASPPIPAFEIPEELRVNGLCYAIPDGNHRWLIGYVTSGRVEAIVYGSTERLDVEAHGLAPFRNADSPRLYERTIAVYCLQMGILGRMREVFSLDQEIPSNPVK